MAEMQYQLTSLELGLCVDSSKSVRISADMTIKYDMFLTYIFFGPIFSALGKFFSGFDH